MFFLVKNMIFCLFITIVIECAVAFILKVRNLKDYLNIIIVNFMTNPLVVSIPVYFNIMYGIKYRNIAYYFLELFAVISEGYIYKKYLKYNKINPFIFSCILNLTSFLTGEIFGRII